MDAEFRIALKFEQNLACNARGSRSKLRISVLNKKRFVATQLYQLIPSKERVVTVNVRFETLAALNFEIPITGSIH